MVNGNKTIGVFSLSCGVSHNMDTEISLSRPESWREEVLRKMFTESDERVTGMRNSEVQYTAGSVEIQHNGTRK